MSRRRTSVVVIAGPPGSGKTTLGKELAPALGAALLDLDVVTGPLTELVLDLIGVRDLSDPRAAALTRERRYETLLGLAEDIARAGVPVVSVGPFRAEVRAERWAALTTRFAPVAHVHLVWLTVSGGETTMRLEARGASRDEVKLKDLRRYVGGLDTEGPSAPHLSLDGARPVPELVRTVLEHIGR